MALLLLLQHLGEGPLMALLLLQIQVLLGCY
jgi:hypothetical protein